MISTTVEATASGYTPDGNPFLGEANADFVYYGIHLDKYSRRKVFINSCVPSEILFCEFYVLPYVLSIVQTYFSRHQKFNASQVAFVLHPSVSQMVETLLMNETFVITSGVRLLKITPRRQTCLGTRSRE
jgi:hypothetical protein